MAELLRRVRARRVSLVKGDDGQSKHRAGLLLDDRPASSRLELSTRTEEDRKIVINGGGIAGFALAHFLGDRGMTPIVTCRERLMFRRRS